MAGRHSTDGNTHSRSPRVRRRRVVVLGGAVGTFLAAAAMATGSTVTAAPAKADFEDLLDPIIQPILTQVTDSIATIDPALATDLTSWTDTFLGDLNSIDSAVGAASTGATTAASNAVPAEDPTSGTYDIPITVQESTEPTVNATVDGADTTLLVDTGSSGLVIPYTDLGSTWIQQLENLFELGFPSGIGESGYSGGVDYIYLTYDNVPVDYDGGTGLDTTAPVDVEIFSWPTSLSSPDNFQDFLADDDSTGILGIGDSSSDGGPTVSPLEAAGYDGVTVDSDELIVDPNNPFTADGAGPLDGAPIPSTDLTETVSTASDGGGTVVGSTSVSDDLDSGGVYGTIPSSIVGSSGEVPDGDWVTVSDGSTVLYSYQVENDGLNALPDESPTATSGTDIDSGFSPFESHPIFIDYSNDTLTVDDPPI
jgi:hypothetical protein